jgi:hypothetical protein
VEGDRSISTKNRGCRKLGGSGGTCAILGGASERLKVQLISYECEAEGRVVELLDRTPKFDRTMLRPTIKIKADSAKRVGKALGWALKYSLVANSIKAPVVVEPKIESQS